MSARMNTKNAKAKIIRRDMERSTCLDEYMKSAGRLAAR